VAGVETSGGIFAAPRVVDAAGPWAAQVAALAGLEVPVVPLKRQVWLTEPTTAVPATAPLTIDSDTGRHVRPREGALLFAMPGGEHPGDERLELDLALADRMVAAGKHRLPALTEGPARGWARLYEVTPDAHPILGLVGTVPGFYLACGFSGHGLMHSPAVGVVLAAQICGEAPPIDISPLSLDRFSAGRLLGDGNVL
jgi:sarcosine oxidase subunit beta